MSDYPNHEWSEILETTRCYPRTASDAFKDARYANPIEAPQDEESRIWCSRVVWFFVACFVLMGAAARWLP